ncbi:MAG: Fe-S cluster assembly protein IscX [Candidatus Korobacteraceae bacterium]|jgi:FeS assembly protein IscX
MSNELTWEHTNKIGILLSNTHPQIEPHTVALNELHGYVTALDEFKGDPKHFHEPTLEAIRDAWNTEFQERTRNWA